MDERKRKLQDELFWGDISRALKMIEMDKSLLEARLSGNFTPLLIAITARNQELVNRLIEMGSKIDLITATYLGRNEMVREFLDRDPSLITKHSPWGAYSLLHIAATHGDSEMVHLLLSRGIDANECGNPDRETPLFFAYRRPFVNAEVLLAHGADIRARAKHGSTLLHGAVMLDDTEWLEFLLRHGADPEAQTDARQSPWMLAVQQKCRRASAILVEFARNHRRP